MGLDSVELVMEFEEEFGVEIPDAAAEAMVTVADAVDVLTAERSRVGRPMPRDEVLARVRRLTGDKANLDPETIAESDRFVDDLGLD